MKQKLIDLINLYEKDLANYTESAGDIIPSHQEYNNLVIDYSKKQVALTNRLIPPYITSQTHGSNVFDGMVELVKDLNPFNILDMGCGAGEMLNKFLHETETQDLYGVTIHVGEYKYTLDDTIIHFMNDLNIVKHNQTSLLRTESLL